MDLLEAFDAESRWRRGQIARGARNEGGAPAGGEREPDPLEAEREARLRALGYLE